MQPLEGGFLQACIRWSSQMAAPSTLQYAPLLPLLPSFHHSFLLISSSLQPSYSHIIIWNFPLLCWCNGGRDWLVSSTSTLTEENSKHGGGESMLLLLPSTDLIRQTIPSNKNVLQSLSWENRVWEQWRCRASSRVSSPKFVISRLQGWHFINSCKI